MNKIESVIGALVMMFDVYDELIHCVLFELLQSDCAY